MRDNDGRKLDHKTLEALRIRAVDQVGEGAHPEDVAAALGLHRKTVYGWLAKYREGGKDALRAQPVPGRPPKLGGAQLSRLYALIAGRDPRQMQFEFALWTREMVREVIRREFGVALSVVSVGRLLRKLGMSPQRPLHRAYQQNRQAVGRWKNEEYPAIRAQAEAEGATVWFADEAGIRSDYHAGTTWSPVGQTPQVKNTVLPAFTLDSVTTISIYCNDCNNGPSGSHQRRFWALLSPSEIHVDSYRDVHVGVAGNRPGPIAAVRRGRTPLLWQQHQDLRGR